MFYAGNVAKKVTGKGKTKNPHETPRSVICNKLAVMHLADTGNKWGKGSNNWDKSGQKDGFAPMFGMITRLIKELKALDASQLS